MIIFICINIKKAEYGFLRKINFLIDRLVLKTVLSQKSGIPYTSSIHEMYNETALAPF